MVRCLASSPREAKTIENTFQFIEIAVKAGIAFSQNFTLIGLQILSLFISKFEALFYTNFNFYKSFQWK